jgi:hypothetical protein
MKICLTCRGLDSGVERANGTIKDNTLKINEYNNKDEMQKGLLAFMMIFYRIHGSLRK